MYHGLFKLLEIVQEANKQKIPPTNPCSCGAFKVLETDIKRIMTKLYCILECAIEKYKRKEGITELGSGMRF